MSSIEVLMMIALWCQVPGAIAIQENQISRINSCRMEVVECIKNNKDRLQVAKCVKQVRL